MITTIVKWGNSRGIRLPKTFLASLNLTDNDLVDISTSNNTIVIKAAGRQHKTLKQRIEGFYGKDFETVLYEFQEVDWGKPQGNEIW